MRNKCAEKTTTFRDNISWKLPIPTNLLPFLLFSQLDLFYAGHREALYLAKQHRLSTNIPVAKTTIPAVTAAIFRWPCPVFIPGNLIFISAWIYAGSFEMALNYRHLSTIPLQDGHNIQPRTALYIYRGAWKIWVFFCYWRCQEVVTYRSSNFDAPSNARSSIISILLFRKSLQGWRKKNGCYKNTSFYRGPQF